MKKTPRQPGFTLVEIVIVIAIGALILLGVLEAARLANQSSRDAQRRNAISQTETALEEWAAAHTGTYTCSDTGNVVSIDMLYGTAQCEGTRTQYLDQGVTAPGTGQPFQPGGPDLDHILITSRDPNNTAAGGYCVQVQLEGGNTVYGATDVNKSGRANPCP